MLGSFGGPATIYNQQIRALNLAWALTEGLPKSGLEDIAIVGGGFGGVTLAAALASKGLPRITLFEKRPVLFPLQQGSDTRWLHPNIYDWPAAGSDNPNAELPVLNWSAGRASDVVARVSREWDELKENIAHKLGGKTLVTEIRSAEYLQLGRARRITWASDPDSVSPKGQPELVAGTKQFATVVLALGFGEEKESEGTRSYWRNESIGQPELAPQVRRFLISGYGDGGLVDLFRVRLRLFRQDRILDDLFDQLDSVKNSLRKIQNEKKRLDVVLPQILNGEFKNEKHQIIKLIQDRLRRDTTALLAIRAGTLAAALRSQKSSFQNRLLLYLLFEAGGFTPTHENAESLLKEHGIVRRNVLLRHGPDTIGNLVRVLSAELERDCRQRIRQLTNKRSLIHIKVLWTGGYWHELEERFHPSSPSAKKEWRKEYLPGPTELIASSICTALASVIQQVSHGRHFRVTLHRTISPAGSPTLQQACEYTGTRTKSGDKARAFPLDEGIIGLAFNRKCICRTKVVRGSFANADLLGDVAALNVGRKTAQQMVKTVRSLLALPILSGTEVCMIIFADSEESFLFKDELLRQLSTMAGDFVRELSKFRSEAIRNYPVRTSKRGKKAFSKAKFKAIETLDPANWPLPVIEEDFTLNFETVAQ